MKIVITGAKGFIGKNLCVMLREQGYSDLVEIDSKTSREDLATALQDVDFVYHLAGVNRPENEDDFKVGNSELTAFIVTELEKSERKTPIMFSSSVQAERDSAYGLSKAQAEQLVEDYGKKIEAKYYVFRFPNVFGKWCRPNYNSFVATFCHNIANDIRIDVHDPLAAVTLVYIDDVCIELISLLSANKDTGFNLVQPEYPTTVGNVAELLHAFKKSRETLVVENVGSGFTRALYSTYLSYLPPTKFSYNVPSYSDDRGVFCEMLKTKEAGQVSFFTAHPGITRGGHYHHSKNEKFLVIKGVALFKFHNITTGQRSELATSSDNLEIVETVPGWTHDITNVGDGELVVMLWANEIFVRETPDTFAMPL